MLSLGRFSEGPTGKVGRKIRRGRSDDRREGGGPREVGTPEGGRREVRED